MMRSKSKLAMLALSMLLIFGGEAQPQVDQAPGWVSSTIFYQIFPERFRNGDPANDPSAQDIQETEVPPPANWRLMPWTGDWYEQAEWEVATGEDFYSTFQWRRYGGDLQGVMDKMNYLQELGITAIYFNPLFEAPSLHKYDQTMYHHIDNNFGPLPEQDKAIWATEDFSDPATWKWTSADSLFLRLVAECHRRGIRVMIDGVFNHVGLTFWAMQDVIKNQQRSAFKAWFKIKSWDDPATPASEFDYAGWYGVRTLPELKQDEHGLIEPVRRHIFAAVRRWMDPNGDGDPSDGVDGWRLDVAEKVNLQFWRDFRKMVRQINPQAYLVGEVWWEDWPNNKIFNPRPWLEGDTFDAVMNYRWAVAVKSFFIDRAKKIKPTAFVRRLAQNRIDENGRSHVMLNLVDSHDTDRLASMILNPDDWFDHRINVRDNPDYQIRRPTDSERAVQKLVAVFQMTYPGAPSIYYGDEAGMWGGDDPDDRKPMLWPDLMYEDEVAHPYGKPRPRDSNKFDQGLFEFYKKLIALRKNNTAFTAGLFQTLLADDEREVVAYVRQTRDSRAIVVFNTGASEQSIDIPFAEAARSVPLPKTTKEAERGLGRAPRTAGQGWRDALAGLSVRTSKGRIGLTLPAQSAAVLVPE